MLLMDSDCECYDVADEDCELTDEGVWCCFDEDGVDNLFEYEAE
jgi:hypothetical protein